MDWYRCGIEQHRLLWWKDSDKSFNHISQLRNIKILSIIEDTNSALWLATSKGLIKFTPTTNEINRFYYKDGLSNNSLMETSQIDDNGIIYFASINGITYFHPDEITRNPIKPQVLITKLQVFNKEVEIGKKRMEEFYYQNQFLKLQK